MRFLSVRCPIGLRQRQLLGFSGHVRQPNRELCNPSYVCASGAIDTLGNTESTQTAPSDFVVGSLVEANTSRTLTEMQLDMALAAPAELRWCVFELSTA